MGISGLHIWLSPTENAVPLGVFTLWSTELLFHIWYMVYDCNTLLFQDGLTLTKCQHNLFFKLIFCMLLSTGISNNRRKHNSLCEAISTGIKRTEPYKSRAKNRALPVSVNDCIPCVRSTLVFTALSAFLNTSPRNHIDTYPLLKKDRFTNLKLGTDTSDLDSSTF